MSSLFLIISITLGFFCLTFVNGENQEIVLSEKESELESYDDFADVIVKMAGSGYREELMKLKFGDVRYAFEIIWMFISSGKMEDAQEYGNELLEYWEKKSDQEVYDNLQGLLKVAVVIESEYYYSRMKEKAAKVLKEGASFKKNIVFNHENYFRTVGLGSDRTGGVSMVEVLASRMRMDPEYSKRHEISVQEFRYGIEYQLYDLLKHMSHIDGDKEAFILFDVFHVMAINLLKNPQEKIYLFLEHPGEGSGLVNRLFKISMTGGRYDHQMKSVLVVLDVVEDTTEFRGTLMHELTHKLMDIVFKNGSKPYWSKGAKDHKKLKEKYQSVVAELVRSAAAVSYFGSSSSKLIKAARMIGLVDFLYSNDMRDNEYIVRFIESIAMGYYSDPEVKKLWEPMEDYWVRYVEPEMRRYIRENAEYDKFMSDWQREYLFDVIYAGALGFNPVDLIYNLISRGQVQKAFEIAVQKIESKSLSYDDVEVLYRHFKEVGEEEKGVELEKMAVEKGVSGSWKRFLPVFVRSPSRWIDEL